LGFPDEQDATSEKFGTYLLATAVFASRIASCRIRNLILSVISKHEKNPFKPHGWQEGERLKSSHTFCNKTNEK
jgi:hypothetical protein